MSVVKDEVKRIADLSKLTIAEEKLERFALQFQQILDYFNHLESAQTESIQPVHHALPEDPETPMREDQTGPSLEVSEALSNAPSQADDHFRVPRVIE